MCLDISEKITEKVRKQLANGRTQFWKVVLLKSGRIRSACDLCDYQAGWHRGTRRMTRKTPEESSTGKIERGIHVFLTRRGAAAFAFRCDVIIPVTVMPDDFVAAGRFDGKPRRLHSAIFTKIYIDPKDYDKAVGATSR